MSDEETEYLEEWVREVINFIVHYHGVSGVIPSDNDILEHLKLTKKLDVDESKIESLKVNELFLKSMSSRGLVINTGHGELRTVIGLTPRQMEVAAVMLNYMDRRSDEKKLRDLGISNDEYSTWLLDNKFTEYLHQRAEKLVENVQHEAHVGLIRGLRQGSVPSIKLYYEMTGRYNPNADDSVNPRMLIAKVLEAIQKHVSDPETLNGLAVELSRIALENTNSPVGNNFSVPSEVVNNKEISRFHV